MGSSRDKLECPLWSSVGHPANRNGTTRSGHHCDYVLVMLIGMLVLAVPVGLLIGTVGVGGVLLPPALVHLGGFGVPAAAGTSSWAFLFTGVAGTLAYARHGTIPWPLAGRLALGAAPAAVAGALVNGLVPPLVVWLVLGSITLGAGAHRLRRGSGGDRTALPTATAVVTGAVVGFGSALTGTGGPVLLVPVLSLLGVAPLAAVAAGQLIQLPLAAFAVLGYGTTGSVHYGLGTLLGVVAAAAVVAGARFARRLPGTRLRQVSAGILLGVGVFLFTLPFWPS
ncbi:sulfite exporter TauE/SafE family protein [Amycolatopsis magusensis]|uniref:sulfite exporter TauE/SafE family protein n=1 Tax=Amycolatopsis magusensis TaxID=882444 RepID=UPI0037A45565